MGFRILTPATQRSGLRVPLSIGALVLSGCLYAALAIGAERKDVDWLRGTGKDLEICLKGEVFDSDGQAATKTDISGCLNSTASKLNLAPKLTGHRFEIWIPVNKVRWYSMWLRATTAESDRVAYAKLNAYQLRQAATDGIKLTLQPPSRIVAVKVVDEGQPVSAATVKADLGFGVELLARTDSNGVARLGLVPDQEINRLTAWTDDRRIGGYSFDRAPRHDPNAAEYEVKLSKCRDQKLRFVDERGLPAPGVDFEIQIATAPPDYNYIGKNEDAWLKTDKAGEAIYHWFPDWKKHHFYAELDSDKWIIDRGPKTIDGTVTFWLKKRRDRRLVNGRVESPNGNNGGFYVSLRSFQGERENYSDIATTFTDPDGAFSVDVLPDATYCAYVLDSKWVGKIIDLIPCQSKPEKITPVDLSVSQGQDVQVTVTSGPMKKAYPNLTISFRREHSYSWRENGATRNGTGGPQWWATTDETGRATTHTLPGKLKATVYTPLWRVQKDIDVSSGESAKISLHREIEKKRTITGRLVATKDGPIEFDSAKIEFGAVDGNYDDHQQVDCKPDGFFSFETTAAQIGVFARTTDGRAAGSTVVKNLDSPIEVQLRPTLDFHGQLLGEGDRPLVGHRVRAVVRIEGDEDYKGMFVKYFDVPTAESKTDEEGNYSLVGLPAETQVNVFADAIDGSKDEPLLGTFYLEPNESRPRTFSRLAKTAARASKTPLADRYKAMLRDCALAGYRLMLIIAGDGDNVTEFINHNLVDYRTNKDCYSFMQLVVSSQKDALDTADAEYLKQKNWQLPPSNHVLAYAIDADGKELNHQSIDVRSNTAAGEAADFVQRNAPPLADAEQKWNAAFAEAKRSNRRVWVRISQRYCGPCFRLTRWLDDQHKLLDKDYVMLKIDDFHDQNGRQVAERLTHGKQYGVPFHAIFDPDEKMLINSAGPLGNIGAPVNFEDQKQIRKMLLASRQHLTDAEVDQLVESAGH